MDKNDKAKSKKKGKSDNGEPPVYCRHSEMRLLTSLAEHPLNPNTHPESQLLRLADVIKGNGWRQPITVSDLSGYIIKGHGRFQAAKLAGFREVPVEVQHYENEAAELADMVADNRIAELAELDDAKLTELLEGMPADVLALTGYTQEELDNMLNADGDEVGDWDKNGGGKLSDTFLVPPFSVLDAKDGRWQERKRAWLESGLRSNETREGLYKGLGKLAEKACSKKGDWMGTSIFDPVLCEVAYSWFSKVGDRVLDPFAGGSVRGVVAAKMERDYVGIDLRQEQVEANRAQGDKLCENPPTWVCGDSNVELDRIEDGAFDMALSCPPYADLEKYSNDPADLSNMDYAQFLEVYRSIIGKMFSKLKDNSFVVWVVGEVRNRKEKSGSYYNFVGDTISAFLEAGFTYYNEMVLLTSIGTNAITARKTMDTGRKPRKVHQNVLVFLKGDAKSAAARMGKVELADFETQEGGEDDPDSEENENE
ncbi:MAG: ParB N-terminal domain-containing protein [Akkermansia sp.]|nr:ParB N-terminal domain-containing protein [Akkermansia sp.]